MTSKKHVGTSVLLGLIGLFILASAPSYAADGTAESDARKVVDTIIAKARRLDNKTTKSQDAKAIESLVDFDKLSLDALGRRASEASATDRKQIAELLKKVITKTVYPEAPKFFKNVTVDYTNEEDANTKTHITSVVTKGTKRSTVEYWLKNAGQGFRVIDFAIEGERWVQNVSDQFDEVIGKHGVKGLISRLQKRANELDKKKP